MDPPALEVNVGLDPPPLEEGYEKPEKGTSPRHAGSEEHEEQQDRVDRHRVNLQRLFRPKRPRNARASPISEDALLRYVLIP